MHIQHMKVVSGLVKCFFLGNKEGDVGKIQYSVKYNGKENYYNGEINYEVRYS